MSFLTPILCKNILGRLKPDNLRRDDIALYLGGGFVPFNLVERLKSIVSQNITVIYASTEIVSYSMSSRVTTQDDVNWLTSARDRISQVVDQDGNECPVGREGELRILRTTIDATSYLNDEEASSRFFRGDYFYPGDMAVRRSDGRIRILGRVADVLNWHGRKVAVAPLEQEIQRALSVDDVCLFSRLNDEGKEQLVIAIQTGRSLRQSDIESIARRFSGFEVVSVATMKSFPRAETGMNKVKRAELRRMIFDQIDRR
jgi:acyl-coenzyme A synthetase/AMP-(fatty) acid ligase